MNKDVEVLDFVYDENQHAVLSVCAEHDLSRAPLAIWNERVARFATWETLASLVGRWWSRRGIPDSRVNLKMSKRLAQFDHPAQLTASTCGFSLVDQYWARPQDSDLTWEQGNFFTNDFDDGIGRILAGISEESGAQSRVSPSATVDGNLPKMWHVGEGGVRELYKAGSGVLKQEPFNEVVATMLYRRLFSHGEYVAYRRESQGYGQYSVCTCFVDEHREFVSARDLYWSSPASDSSPTYSTLAAAYERLDVPGVRAQLDRVLTCDYILGNIDRHLGNLGAIRMTEGGAFERCAPIFDSGLSLLCYEGEHDQDALSVLANPFLPRQSQQLALVSDLTWFDSTRLESFSEEACEELAACKSRYMDASRLAFLQAFIRSGIRTVEELQALEPADGEDVAAVDKRAQQIDALRAQFLHEDGFGSVFVVE